MSATAAPMKPKKGALAGQSSFDMSSAERVLSPICGVDRIHSHRQKDKGVEKDFWNSNRIRIHSAFACGLEALRAFGGTGFRGKLRGDRGATCGKYFRSLVNCLCERVKLSPSIEQPARLALDLR
jgi:hypothetical protein